MMGPYTCHQFALLEAANFLTSGKNLVPQCYNRKGMLPGEF